MVILYDLCSTYSYGVNLTIQGGADSLPLTAPVVCYGFLKEASRCVIEKPANIGLDQVIDTLLLEGPSQYIEALVRAAPRTVAIATLFEQGLEQRFNHPFGGQFHNLVLEAADPERSTLLTPGLRDIHPTLGLRPVAHPLEAGGQICKIRLQI